MAQNIYIEDYSDKSFVVRGETREYKDSLKSLGGKWNSRLTDKDSGDVFGAWMFWNGKRKDIDNWFKKGCPELENNQTDYNQQSSTNNSNRQLSTLNFQRLESKVDNLTKLLEQLCSTHNIKINKLKNYSNDDYEIEDEDDETYSNKSRRRLLAKK